MDASLQYDGSIPNLCTAIGKAVRFLASSRTMTSEVLREFQPPQDSCSTVDLRLARPT